MAMTGGAAYLVKSERTNYGSNSWTTDLYIYVKVISQNVVANTSTIALGMYVYSQYSIAWSDFGTNGTSYIGTATSGANCFTFTNGQSGSGTKWLVEDKQVTPAQFAMQPRPKQSARPATRLFRSPKNRPPAPSPAIRPVRSAPFVRQSSPVWKKSLRPATQK